MPRTEHISSRYKGIDTWPASDISQTFWEAQMRAVACVQSALPAIEKSARAIADRLRLPKSRLIYTGAGSSGLLAMQDGMEMTPTFGWPLERLIFLMAGGDKARLTPIGYCEDDGAKAIRDIEHNKICSEDVLIAVAASGNTTYTVEAAKAARKSGALVIGIANDEECQLFETADIQIFLDSGVEVIAGSTRMNAGTAQKTALGILSSMTMIHLGHVVDGMMVSVTVDNKKLMNRAAAIVAKIAGVNTSRASEAIKSADGSVKVGVLLALGFTRQQAEQALIKHHNYLREAMTDDKVASSQNSLKENRIK